MLREEMRDTLRGWLQDAGTDPDWDNLHLNRYLNLGLKETQKTLVTIDPEAVKATYKANLVVPDPGKDALYAYPAATWAVVELSTSADGIYFTPLRRTSLHAIRDGSSERGFIPYSASAFMLYPTPTVAVVDGLRAIVVPTLVMAEDTDECPLPAAFHTLAIKHAQKLAMKDIGEPTDKLESEIRDERSELPKFYLTASEPSFVTLDIGRDYDA